VAEVGASILANETGTPRNKQNTQAYINGRLTYIKDKPNEVIQAFTKAMKGAEYILDINQDK
jgi:antirestriction protein ArdC